MEKKLLIQDIAEAIATKGGINKKTSESFVKALFETIEQGLTDDKFVKIKGLGTFKVIAVGERESVNINTGERFSISGHDKITFTPETSLKDLVNRPFSHFQTVILNDETEIEELESVDTLTEEQISEESTTEEETTNEPSAPSGSPTSAILNKTDTEELAPSNSEALSTGAPQSPQEEKSTKDVANPAEETQQDAPTPSTIVTSEETKGENSKDSENKSETIVPTTQKNDEEDVEPTDNAIKEISEKNENDVSAEISLKAQPALNTTPVEEKSGNLLDEVVVSNNEEQADIVEKSTEETEVQNEEAEKDESVVQNENATIQENTEARSSYAEPICEDCKNSFVESECEDTSETHEEKVTPIIDTNDREKKKRNFWKTLAFGLLAILILLLTYFAGYFKVFCPCELWNNANSTENLPLIPPISADSIYIEQDSLSNDTANAVNDSISLNKDTLNELEMTVIANGKTQTRTTLEPKKAQVAQQAERKDETPRFKQVEGGKYLIVGTLRTHKIERGETIRTIAQEVYGSKGYATYIITHNELANPNLIDTGTVIKLPKLEKRQQ